MRIFFEVFQNSGVDLSKPVISMCRTGIDACSVASAAHLIGKHDVSVYYVSNTHMVCVCCFAV